MNYNVISKNRMNFLNFPSTFLTLVYNQKAPELAFGFVLRQKSILTSKKADFKRFR